MSSLFTNNTSSVFGSTPATSQPAASGGLFGSTSNTNNTQNQSGGLFGGATAQNQPSNSSPFGSNVFGSAGTNNTQNQSGGLFGGASTTNQPQQGGGLFGASANTQNQATNTGGLFGSTATNTQNRPAGGTSLFGNNAAPAQNQQTSNTGGLFGGLANSSAQPAAPQNTSTSLFQPSQSSRTFAERAFSANHPQQIHLSSLLQTGLGAGTPFGSLGAASQHDLAKSRLRDANISTRTNEKSVLEQIQTLIQKWDPQSQDTLMQTYLYNAVNSAYAPFYYRNADESEAEWEKALENKPAPLAEENGQNVSFIPILVRGFRALGDRIEYQAQTVHEMRARLHEMNNSLDAVMARHQQNLTVRLENANRQHAALAQRCLRLAVKTQVLRQKNYPLDESEEQLRVALQKIEKGAFDPELKAREEEVWARMVALRERARWLEEEGKRLGGQVEQQGGNGGLSEEVLARTKRILKEYDAQITHLAKELESVGKEFGELK